MYAKTFLSVVVGIIFSARVFAMPTLESDVGGDRDMQSVSSILDMTIADSMGPLDTISDFVLCGEGSFDKSEQMHSLGGMHYLSHARTNLVSAINANPGNHGTPVVPAPGALLLASIGAAVVGWMRKRRAL